MKYLVISIFAVIAGLAVTILTPSNTSAAASGYATGWVNGTEYKLTNSTQAKDYLAALCGWSGYGHPVAVAAYPSNMSLNETTGQLTYTANISWRSCSDANSTRAFAVIGYPAAAPGSIATCPDAGTYAQPHTHDCIKYTNSDAGHMQGHAKLNCPTGTGYTCVTGGDNAAGLFRSVIERNAKAPSTSVSTSSQNMAGSVPDWANATKTSGSYTFYRGDAFCTYYKWNSNGASGYANCVSLTIKASWVRYNYALTPTINVTDGATIELPRTALGVNGTVSNAGPTSSRPDIDWRITMVRYSKGATIPAAQKAGGPSAGLPCTFFTSGQACDDSTGSGVQKDGYKTSTPVTHDTKVDIAAYPLGTQICFALSVRQYSHETDDWMNSALRCYVVGKKPKVNVLGSDLLVGRTIAGAAATTSGRVVTAATINAAGTFGSWAEYAIAPKGAVTSMASGSGYVGGAAKNLNLLTFVNSGNTGETCSTANGCYQHDAQLPNVASRFRTSADSAVYGGGALNDVETGLYRGSGDITIPASTVAAGKWIVINAPLANVTISGDIRYANGPFADASRLPQLIIIANSITINDNVRTVDAWLLAPGRLQGGAVAGGVIQTCNHTASSLNESVCANPLTINGPVIAHKLVMLRTGGAGAGASAGDPAETFNFRPDAYIWALRQSQSSGRVTTVSTKELPPRY